jgi:hypothetical protein
MNIEDVRKEMGCEFPIHELLYNKDFVRLV